MNNRFTKRLVLTLTILLTTLTALAILPTAFADTFTQTPTQAVNSAWTNAQRAGVYTFTTQMVQTTIPAPNLSAVGASAVQEVLYAEGSADPSANFMHLKIWQQGSPLQPRDGVEIRVNGAVAEGRALGATTWETLDNTAPMFAPDNDALSWLAGADEVAPLGTGQFRAAYPPLRDAEELAVLLSRATEEGVRVGFRGSGRSYGDAALNGGQLVLDMRAMNRVLSWDRETGILEAERANSVLKGLARILVPINYLVLEDLLRPFRRTPAAPPVASPSAQGS